MEQEEISVGLDIGTSKVCAVIAKLNKQKRLEILGIGEASSEGVEEGVIQNIGKVTDAIATAIEQATLQANQATTSELEITSVIVGMGSRDVTTIKQKGSITRDDNDGDDFKIKDIDRLVTEVGLIVKKPGYYIEHIVPQEFTIGGITRTANPLGYTGIALSAECYVILNNKDRHNHLKRCLGNLNLTIEKEVATAIATTHSVLTVEMKRDGVALVDIGAGTTDIAIYHNGILRHIATFPMGGNTLDNDIRQGLGVKLKQAEELKNIYGSALAADVSEKEATRVPIFLNRPPQLVSLKNLAIIIEERLKEIAALVKAEIIKAGYKDKIAEGIILTGGVAQMPYIEELFYYVTGFHSLAKAPIEKLGKIADEEIKNPKYATAVGLAWLGYEETDERENEYRQSREESEQQMPLIMPTNNQNRKDSKDIKKDEKKKWGWLGSIRDILTDDL